MTTYQMSLISAGSISLDSTFKSFPFRMERVKICLFPFKNRRSIHGKITEIRTYACSMFIHTKKGLFIPTIIISKEKYSNSFRNTCNQSNFKNDVNLPDHLHPGSWVRNVLDRTRMKDVALKISSSLIFWREAKEENKCRLLLQEIADLAF
jgi:hypothetical protein